MEATLPMEKEQWVIDQEIKVREMERELMKNNPTDWHVYCEQVYGER